MTEGQTNIIIVGYGNVGRGVHQAIKRNSDMNLVGIISRDAIRVIKELEKKSGEVVAVWEQESVLGNSRSRDYLGPVDVAILCGGSKDDLPVQGPAFAEHFSTVDSYDTHAKIPEYFKKMDEIAKANGRTSIVSAGWDPGTFSLERVLGDAFLPGSKRQTFWGPGVSQGHSDAIRTVEGVADAIQYTMPIDEALNAVRRGDNPELTTRQKHERHCYVALKPGANADRVRQAIVTMPNYFADNDTQVNFVDIRDIQERKQKMYHEGFVFTSGKTGNGNKAIIEYRNQWQSNPEATGNILVACARACQRFNNEGKTGAFTMLDIAPAYYSSRSSAELLKDFM